MRAFFLAVVTLALLASCGPSKPKTKTIYSDPYPPDSQRQHQ